MDISISCRAPLFFTLCLFALTWSLASGAAEPRGVSAQIRADLGQDSNVRRTREQLADSDTFFALLPKLHWTGLLSKHRLHANYRADIRRFAEQGELNYNDHHTEASAQLNHSHRLRSEFTLSYHNQHEAAGSNNAVSLAQGAFNRYRSQGIQGQLTYGTKASIGQLIIKSEHRQQRYGNNNQAFRNYNLNLLNGRFYYRAAPKTRFMLESSFNDFDYPEESFNGATQSNTDQRVALGVEWQRSAQTTGIFKAGYQEKSYAADAFGEISGLTLALDMHWNPTANTEVKIGVSRSANESAIINTGGFIREFIHADVQHKINPLTTLTARIGLGEEEFSFSTQRQDKRYDFAFGLQRELAYRLRLAVEFLYDERDSNQALNDFAANMLRISFTSNIN